MDLKTIKNQVTPEKHALLYFQCPLEQSPAAVVVITRQITSPLPNKVNGM